MKQKLSRIDIFEHSTRFIVEGRFYQLIQYIEHNVLPGVFIVDHDQVIKDLKQIIKSIRKKKLRPIEIKLKILKNT